ncbi:MAG: PAS domain-containing sensor histidine kinase [Thermostichales cyanobacterium HHBFW_bins_127]
MAGSFPEESAAVTAQFEFADRVAMQPPPLLQALPPEVAVYVEALQQQLETVQQERGMLLRTVAQLRHELQKLRQEKADLEALQAITQEHGDYLSEQLYQRTAQLSQANQDLSLLLDTVTQHGDIIENSLYEAEHRYRTILDNTLGGIGQLSLTGTLIGANVALRRILGLSLQQELPLAGGQGLPRCLYVEPEAFEGFWQRLQESSIVVGWEVQIQRLDGEVIWVSQSARAVLDGQGHPRYYELLVENITERKNIERLKDEFIATVSHELRTPLTGIQGALGLVINGVVGEVSAPVQTLLTMAFQCGERLSRLVNDILDLEKIEAGRLELQCQHQPLLPILTEAITAMTTYGASYGVAYELQPVAPELSQVRVDVDALRLQQVFAQLLSNAAKFSPRGETVTITLTDVTRDGMGYARVAIRDRGAGIPESLRSRLFQKFTQGDTGSARSRGGSGLGLSMCKALVEQMGGAIHFESAVGKGTTFYVDLPL